MKWLALVLSLVLLIGCVTPSRPSSDSGKGNATAGEVVWMTNPPDQPKPQKLESAQQAVERAKVVLGPKEAARYEATRIDGWLPTVPTDKDSPRTAWKVMLYDASGRYAGWIVLDAETGGPLQAGDV